MTSLAYAPERVALRRPYDGHGRTSGEIQRLAAAELRELAERRALFADELEVRRGSYLKAALGNGRRALGALGSGAPDALARLQLHGSLEAQPPPRGINPPVCGCVEHGHDSLAAERAPVILRLSEAAVRARQTLTGTGEAASSSCAEALTEALRRTAPAALWAYSGLSSKALL